MSRKRLFFTSKLPTPWHHGMAHALFPTNLHSSDGPIAYGSTTALIENTHAVDEGLSSALRTIVLKTAPKQPFLDTELAIEGARRLEMQQNLFSVMRLRSPVALSYFDTGFELRCGRKDSLTAYLLVLLLLLLACYCYQDSNQDRAGS